MGAAALLAPGSVAAAAPSPGDAIAWPDVPLLDGTRLIPAQWAGGSAVVVFWATTCPFCRRHNQHLQKLHAASEAVRAAGRLAPKVLTVARDRDEAVVRRYAKTQGYGFPITMAYGPMAQALSSRNVIPLTVTVDARGRLRQVFPGEMFEEDVMEFLGLAAS